MVKTFADFPELLIVDASNRLTDIHMQTLHLYLLMAMDGNGKEEIIATFLSTDHLPETFRHIVQTFLHHNAEAATKIRAVMIDQKSMPAESDILTHEIPSLIGDPVAAQCFRDGVKHADKLINAVEAVRNVCTELVDMLL